MDSNTGQPPILIPEPESDLIAAQVALQQLRENLAGANALAVLEQVTHWLETRAPQIAPPLQPWLELIVQIDQLAQHHQLRLVPQYLDTQRMRKLTESQLWRTTFGYWQRLGEAYLRCLLRYQAAPEGESEFRAQLPLVLSRLLHTLMRQLKWTLLRYARVEDRIWRELGQGYLLAESWGLADRSGRLCERNRRESTPRQELLKALMLAQAAPDALRPAQLHIAERVTSCLSHHFALHNTAGPGCGFRFDLSMHQPPTRARAGVAVAPLQRFFGAGTSAPALQALLTQAQLRGALPQEVRLGGEFTRDDLLATLRHLQRHWSDARPGRRDERERAVARLTVLPGLIAATRWIDATPGGGEEWIPPRAESWIVFDASASGFGALLPAQAGDWLAVGALMAVRAPGQVKPRMAVLRRITADAENQSRVGVEYLGQQSARVTLHPDIADGIVQAGMNAILLSQQPDAQGTLELLQPPGGLELARSLRMQLGAQRYRLETLATLEQGRDYRHVRYHLQGQD